MNIYIYTEWYIFKYEASDYSNSSEWIRIPYHNKELDFYGDYSENSLYYLWNTHEKTFCQEFTSVLVTRSPCSTPETLLLWNNIQEDAPGEYKRPVVNFKELLLKNLLKLRPSLNLLVFVQAPCVFLSEARVKFGYLLIKSGIT